MEIVSNVAIPRFLKLSLGLVFLISLASLGAIIVFIDPYKAGFLMHVIFSTVVFLVFFSMFSIIGIRIRKKFISKINSDRIFKMAFRQSFFLSVVITAYIWMSHFNLFKIWIAIPVFLIVFGMEYYFLTKRHKLV